MSNPNEPRFLTWRLRGSVSIQETTPNETITYETVNDLFPLDPDEKTVIGMNLSLNEFIDLASAIDIGRDIGYPEQSINIWFKWVQALQEAGGMVTCNDIADCLNDPVVFNVLINNNEFVETLVQNETFVNTLVQNSNVFNTWNVTETTGAERLPEHAEPVKEPLQECDLDALWAGIREMVERIDQQGRDLLEDLTVLNDRAERIQGAIDLVPILGDTIADVADFFTETIPDLLNAYNAYSNPTTLDIIACDLFSMVCGECRYPTYDEVFNYFKDRTGLTLDNFATTNYLAVWTGLKVVAAVPEPVWMAINTWQTFTLGFGGKWNSSYGKKTFAIWASFGEDLPNDNWEILCDACTPIELCAEYDFTTGLHGFSVESGDWIASEGLRSYTNEAGRFNFFVMSNRFNIIRFEYDYYVNGSIGTLNNLNLTAYRDGAGLATSGTGASVANQEATASQLYGISDVNGLRIFTRNSGTGASGTITVRRLRVYYTLVNGSPQNSTPC